MMESPHVRSMPGWHYAVSYQLDSTCMLVANVRHKTCFIQTSTLQEHSGQLQKQGYTTFFIDQNLRFNPSLMVAVAQCDKWHCEAFWLLLL